MTEAPDALRALLVGYLSLHPGDAPRLRELSRRLEHEPGGLLDRACMAGHATGSMLVLDPDGTHALVILHRGLGLWLQPGGHYEPPGSLLDTALREVAEETGMVGVTTVIAGGVPVLLDVDTHPIPANPRRGEAEHLHHDFCWVGRAATRDGLVPQDAEVAGVAWRNLTALLADDNPRMARLAGRAFALAP